MGTDLHRLAAFLTSIAADRRRNAICCGAKLAIFVLVGRHEYAALALAAEAVLDVTSLVDLALRDTLGEYHDAKWRIRLWVRRRRYAWHRWLKPERAR